MPVGDEIENKREESFSQIKYSYLECIYSNRVKRTIMVNVLAFDA